MKYIEKNNTYFLEKILEKQNAILDELKNLNENIIKYCGGEQAFKTEELKQKMFNAKFTKNQLEIIKEFVDYKTEELKKEIMVGEPN